MLFGYLILLIAVIISSIAAWYSIAGLAAIFAAAVIPVMIMGGALEAGKIVATVWLHNNWRRAGIAFKLYLIPAIVALMLLTSMGIFGFLSKAHSDQSLVSGDSMAKVAIYDEKIKTAKDNIDANRRALKQMDEAVDQVMGRSTDEKGADKAVAIRRGQQKERARLLAEISAEQKTITTLSEERAPLAAEFRKIEADVGPVKYIAALIYGDNAEQGMLEAAVRWVIILIVIVFDPLALTLILAGNKQLEWARAGKGGWVHEEEPEEEHVPPPNREGFSFFEFEKKPEEPVVEPEPVAEIPPEKTQEEKDAEEEAEEERKLQEFFDAAHARARLLDQEAAARQVEEANELLAEVETAVEPELDIIAADAEHIALLEAKQQETQTALDTIIEKYNELANEKDNLSTNVAFLQRQSDQRQLDLIQAQTENTTLTEAVLEIESQLTEAEQAAEQLRQRIAELERAAQSEVVLQEPEPELEPEMPSDIVELEQPTQQLEKDVELVERPGDYITPPDDTINTVYNDERLVSRFDKEELAKESPRTFISRGGVQSNYDMLKANRTAPPPVTYQDDIPESGRAGFGVRFPETAGKGDMWLRVDMMPNRAYKFNGIKWIEVDKSKTDRFAYDQEYIRHLHQGLVSGEYDLDDLNDTERAQVEQFRNNTIL
jgi:hypothetical protein